MGISETGWGTAHKIVVTGRTSSGFDVTTGAYWEGSGESSVQYIIAAVKLSGLPDGLGIDGQVGFSTLERANVSCEDGRVRAVTLASAPVQLGGLRLEQVSVDLRGFLTPERRDAICSIQGNVKWVVGGHQMEQRLRGDPYPKKRILASAMSGDPEALQITWEHRDRIASLVESVLGDAEIATRALRTEPGEQNGEQTDATESSA